MASSKRTTRGLLTQKWVEMGAAHVGQVSGRECHLDSAVPTTKLH